MKRSTSKQATPGVGDPLKAAWSAWRISWGALALFLLLGSAVVFIWQSYEREGRRSQERQLALLTDQLASRFEEFIEARLSLLGFIRDGRLEGLMLDEASFQKQAKHLQTEFGGFHAINWVDAEGFIRWVSPPEGNRDAVGRNVFEHEGAGRYLRAARSAGEPRMTAPLDLFQGGRAFTAYYPEVDAEGRIVGYVNGVFLIASLVEQCLGEEVLGAYDLSIHDGGTPVFARQLEPSAMNHRLPLDEAIIELLGRTWTFELNPRAGSRTALAHSSHLSVLIGGLTFAAAIALALWLVLIRLDQERRAAQARLELEERLQSSQKMEAIGQLAGGVAHDFNNILTAILGNAELASDCPQLKGHYRTALEQVIVAGERAAALTRRLLSFASKQVSNVERLHLNHELRELKPMLERLVRADISLHFDLSASEDLIEMDPGQVSQVVLNLVINSVDAMPSGGELHISTREVSESLAPGTQEWVALVVSDNGLGMDEATRLRVLEPFFTTKPVGKGTGLGLSIVYGEVLGVGGELEIESRVGEGTTIEVRLPRVSSWQVAPLSPVAHTSEPEGRLRILLVEDEQMVLKIVRQILEGAGHEVQTAQDGVQALELLSAGASFDLLVTDAVMPALGGIELIRRVRELGYDFGVVLMSGYSQDSLESTTTAANVHRLEKPFSAREIVQIVERAHFEAHSSTGLEGISGSISD